MEKKSVERKIKDEVKTSLKKWRWNGLQSKMWTVTLIFYDLLKFLMTPPNFSQLKQPTFVLTFQNVSQLNFIWEVTEQNVPFQLEHPLKLFIFFIYIHARTSHHRYIFYFSLYFIFLFRLGKADRFDGHTTLVLTFGGLDFWGR